MSLQLILYPQSYNGIYSSVSVPTFNQYIPDPQFTSGFFVYNQPASFNHGGYTSAFEEVTASFPPTSAWSAYYQGTTGIYHVTPQPTMIGMQTCFYSTDTISGGEFGVDTALHSNSGIYIEVTGLTVGFQYDQFIDVSGMTGIDNMLFSGSTLGSWSAAGGIAHSMPFNLIAMGAAFNGQNLHTFTATHTTMVFSLHYLGNQGNGCCIESVSITESSDNPTMLDIWKDGQVICDLYTDESIPLTLSIDNFKNVAEKTQSYSKAFSLPSTKKNNKIFTCLYDVTKSAQADGFAFNPYRKTKALLKEDGYTIFDGFLKMIDINETEKELSYNVNLYSDIVSLKDTLGAKKIKDLANGFTELEHNYNKTTIKASWGGNLPISALPAGSHAGAAGATTTDVLKYPFCNWHGNIYLQSGQVKLDLLEDAFRPWLRCKYLVDRIISEAGFSYSSTFLNSSDFTKLFMDFNWGSDSSPSGDNGISVIINIDNDTAIGTSGGGYSNVVFDDPPSVPLTDWDYANNRYTAQFANCHIQVTGMLVFLNEDSAPKTVTCRFREVISGTALPTSVSTTFTIPANDNQHWFPYQAMTLPTAGDYLEIQVSYTGGGTLKQSGGNCPIAVFRNIEDVTTSTLINGLRGELKQWDYFSGLMKMFNLMVMRDKDDPTKLVIEPYTNIFLDNADIKTHDWTEKVDATEINLKSIDLKKKITFKYKEDKKDYGTASYYSATSSKYGDAEIDASSFTMLEGETKVEAKPFAATFIKPIFDNFSPLLTIPIMYEVKSDGTSQGIKNKPRILYDVTADNVGGKKYIGNGFSYYIPQHGYNTGTGNPYYSENQQYFSQFAHVTDIPTTNSSKDYNFGSSQLISTIGAAPVDNLFNVYWAPYYDELYNADTKVMTLKVFLTPADLANFNFFDRIRIKNREYRVNKIDYTAGELSKVEFILIS